MTSVHRSDRNLELRATDDFASMRLLALASGLEDGDYTDFVAAFGVYDGRELVGCAGLKQVGGVYTVECLAVTERLRGKGLGKRLVEAVEHEARSRGADQLWALARAPGFFERMGFHVADPPGPGGPSLKGCASCNQYMKTCEPAIVMKRL